MDLTKLSNFLKKKIFLQEEPDTSHFSTSALAECEELIFSQLEVILKYGLNQLKKHEKGLNLLNIELENRVAVDEFLGTKEHKNTLYIQIPSKDGIMVELLPGQKKILVYKATKATKVESDSEGIYQTKTVFVTKESDPRLEWVILDHEFLRDVNENTFSLFQLSEFLLRIVLEIYVKGHSSSLS